MDRLNLSGRRIGAGITTAIFYFLIVNQAGAAAPVLSDLLITDVTDRSFALVWTTDQPGQPQIELYLDASATTLAPNTQFVLYPVATGNPVEENREAARDEIVQAAQAKGIVKITVSGLLPDTDYYVKFGLDTVLSETTLCPDSGATYCPGSSGLASMRTQAGQTRTINLGSEQIFENDQLLILDQDVQLGELLVIGVESAQHPISIFAGDGIPLPYQLVDLNNLYNQDFSMRVRGASESSMGNHGEALVVRRYRGVDGDATQLQRMGDTTGKGEALRALSVSLGDCNGDTRINGYDIFVMEHFLASTFTAPDNATVAFHPVLCNLYTEEGRHSVETMVNIDQADQDLLRSLLIGTIGPQDLPVQP